MMEETIRENPDYQKIDKRYIVNRNDNDYHIALGRRARQMKQQNLENRLDVLEDKLNHLIDLLQTRL